MPEQPPTINELEDRERRVRLLAFEAISIAIDYDGLTQQTGHELLRRVPARLLMAQVFIDEERGQELLAWATEGRDV